MRKYIAIFARTQTSVHLFGSMARQATRPTGNQKVTWLNLATLEVLRLSWR